MFRVQENKEFLVSLKRGNFYIPHESNKELDWLSLMCHSNGVGCPWETKLL